MSNNLFFGDNLVAPRNSTHHKTVDPIHLDPPIIPITILDLVAPGY